VLVPAVAGVTDCVPFVFCEPLHAPLAVQAVAFVDDQVSVALDPTIIGVGETEMLTVGAAGVLTARVAEALPVPPLPVQVSVYVAVPATAGVSDCVPLMLCVPLQAPLAEHVVAFVDDHVNVALEPRVMAVEFKDKVTVGCGVAAPPPPLQPAIRAPVAAHPSSSHRPRGKFLDQKLWFRASANVLRVGEVACLPVTCASINAFLLPQRALLPSEETR
jgi:hypothetical protein